MRACLNYGCCCCCICSSCCCCEEEAEAARRARLDGEEVNFDISELEQMKERAKQMQLPPVYAGKWATASEDEVQEELARGTPYTYHFRVPKEGSLKIDDLIRGESHEGQMELRYAWGFCDSKKQWPTSIQFLCLLMVLPCIYHMLLELRNIYRTPCDKHFFTKH